MACIRNDDLRAFGLLGSPLGGRSYAHTHSPTLAGGIQGIADEIGDDLPNLVRETGDERSAPALVLHLNVFAG